MIQLISNCFYLFTTFHTRPHKLSPIKWIRFCDLNCGQSRYETIKSFETRSAAAVVLFELWGLTGCGLAWFLLTEYDTCIIRWSLSIHDISTYSWTYDCFLCVYYFHTSSSPCMTHALQIRLILSLEYLPDSIWVYCQLTEIIIYFSSTTS